MATRGEVREFLRSRRAQITPSVAGLVDGGGERRVPGLRREEVARLAGVSLDYYTRLERGNIGGASESVLVAIARALQLDDVEREHLMRLARSATPVPTRPVTSIPAIQIRPSIQRMLDQLTAPAIIYNSRQDLIAANIAGRALYAPLFDAVDHPNLARFIFLDGRAETFYEDWPLASRTTAAMLRLEAGRNPLDERLTSLVGELSTRSLPFRAAWSSHDVHEHRTGDKVLVHPEVGRMLLTFDVFEVTGEAGLSLVTYGAEPSTIDAQRLALLGSWASSSAGALTAGGPADRLSD